MIVAILFPPEKFAQISPKLSKLAMEKGLFPLCCCQVLANDENGNLVPGGIMYTLGKQAFPEEEAAANGNGHDKTPEELPEPEILKGTVTITNS